MFRVQPRVLVSGRFSVSQRYIPRPRIEVHCPTVFNDNRSGRKSRAGNCSGRLDQKERQSECSNCGHDVVSLVISSDEHFAERDARSTSDRDLRFEERPLLVQELHGPQHDVHAGVVLQHRKSLEGFADFQACSIVVVLERLDPVSLPRRSVPGASLAKSPFAESEPVFCPCSLSQHVNCVVSLSAGQLLAANANVPINTTRMTDFLTLLLRLASIGTRASSLNPNDCR